MTKISITDSTMVTPIGFTTQESFAAAIAGVAGLVEHELLSERLQEDHPGSDDPVTACVGRVPGLKPDLSPLERCAKLLAHVSESIAETSLSTPAEFAILLTLPDLHGVASEDVRSKLTEAATAGLPGPAMLVETFTVSKTAGIESLDVARAILKNAPSAKVLIMAVDTFGDIYSLCDLDAMKRLKHSGSMGGFIPGEACAAITLEVSGHGMDVVGVGVAIEKSTIDSPDPCFGLGLADSIVAAAEGRLTTDRVDHIISDLNGEVYGGEEWAAAIPKSFDQSNSELVVIHPADCMGDVGRAAAVIGLAFAKELLKNEITTRDEVLVTASCNQGNRAAAIISRPKVSDEAGIIAGE